VKTRIHIKVKIRELWRPEIEPRKLIPEPWMPTNEAGEGL
jgi:hypothetical protein